MAEVNGQTQAPTAQRYLHDAFSSASKPLPSEHTQEVTKSASCSKQQTSKLPCGPAVPLKSVSKRQTRRLQPIPAVPGTLKRCKLTPQASQHGVSTLRTPQGDPIAASANSSAPDGTTVNLVHATTAPAAVLSSATVVTADTSVATAVDLAAALADVKAALAKLARAAGNDSSRQRMQHFMELGAEAMVSEEASKQLEQTGILADVEGRVNTVMRGFVPKKKPVAIGNQWDTTSVTNDVQHMLKEFQETHGDFRFDFGEYANVILDEECVDVFGKPQSGKSSAIAVGGLVAATAQMPVILIACETNATTEALVTKVQEHYFDKMNVLESVKAKNIKLEAVYAGTAAAVKKQLAPGEPMRRLLSGQTMLVVSYTKEQIDRLRREVVEYTKLRFLLILEEADKMHSSAPTPSDNPNQGRRIAREKALLQLCTCLDPPSSSSAPAPATIKPPTAADETQSTDIADDDTDSDTAAEASLDSSSSVSRTCSSRYPALVALIQISATPIDMLVWHMGKQLPMRYLAPVLEGTSYSGEESLQPFENADGEPVFLQPNDVTAATHYGLQLPKAKGRAKATSSSAAENLIRYETQSEPEGQPDKPLVLQYYDSIATAAANGQEGLLVIDITCPGVRVEKNTLARAKTLAEQYPGFVFLVVSGQGVQLVTAEVDADGACSIKVSDAAKFSGSTRRAFRQETEALAAAAAVEESSAMELVPGQPATDDAGTGLAAQGEAADVSVAEAVLEPEQEVERELTKVLMKYDNRLHKVLVIKGYAMIRRSLSMRTDVRVPTHILCAPSVGTSLADFLQMMGRGMGNVGKVLKEYGLDGVRVLCRKDDYEAMQKYYELVEYLYRCRANGSTTGLIKTLRDVPAEFQPLLRHKRRQGQKGLNSSKVLDRLNEYLQPEGAATARRLAVRGADGRLSSNMHAVMLGFAWAAQVTGKQQLSYADLQECWPDELYAYAQLTGRRGPFKDLRKADPPLLAYPAGNVGRGVHELTAEGRQYVEKFAVEIEELFAD